MFTGIVTELASVIDIKRERDHVHLLVRSQLTSGLSIGASVAIDGVCLTVTAFNQDSMEFDVIQETLKLTTLGSLQPNSMIHLERSLRIGDEMGGHLVSGHVHGVGKVTKIEPSPFKLWLEVPQGLSHYIFAKGFISLAGTSLTVVERVEDSFSVALIPETLRMTKFKDVKIGDFLNIELDQQTKTIVDTISRIMAQKPSDGS